MGTSGFERADRDPSKLIEDAPRRRGRRERARIDFFTPEPGPAGGSGHPAEFTRKHLGMRGFPWRTNRAITEANGSAKVVRAQNGRSLESGLEIGIPPRRPTGVLYEAGLVESPNGIRITGPDRLETPWNGAYAIGGNADVPASKAGGRHAWWSPGRSGRRARHTVSQAVSAVRIRRGTDGRAKRGDPRRQAGV